MTLSAAMADAAPVDPPPPLARRTMVWLIAILFVALAARVYFVAATATGLQPEVIDVDTYLARAENLAGHRRGWIWSIQAIEYRNTVKAPLYPVLLSLIALTTPDRLHGGLGVLTHVLAGVLSTGLLFWIGRTLHSDRAGLIAAGIYAIWHPDVTAVTTFLQEHYWIPFTLAGFGFFLSGTARDGPDRHFAAAGVMFGLAALVRSMQVYYLPIALTAYLIMERGRRHAFRHAAVLLGAFIFTIGPYSVYISSRLGGVVLVDNQGSSNLRVPGTPQPSISQGIGHIVGGFASDPHRYIARRAQLLDGLVQVRGGRWLEVEGRTTSKVRAQALKLVTHLSNDLLYIVAVLAAPIGLAVARRSREAVLLALWIALNIVLMILFFFTGARYRQAYAPEMIVLAAVALSGQWQRPSRLAAVAASVTTIGVGFLVLPSVPGTLLGRAEYGVERWTITREARDTSSTARSGFNLVPKAGRLAFSLKALRRPLDVAVTIDQRPADRLRFENADWMELSYPWPHEDRLVFIELESSTPVGGDRSPLIMISTHSIAR